MAMEKKGVSVVIPALNEAATIVDVVSVASNHNLIDEVIVVDDGSTDDTAFVATQAGAQVLRLAVCGGKSGALSVGVAQASHQILLFLDADLVGLTEEMITTLVTPLLEGRVEMFVGIHRRRTQVLNRIAFFFPIIGGERALTKSLWYAVPVKYKKRFQIEIALNYFSKQTDHKMDWTFLSGLKRVIKEKKYGLLVGLWRRLGMFLDICLITVRLYFFDAIVRRVK